MTPAEIVKQILSEISFEPRFICGENPKLVLSEAELSKIQTTMCELQGLNVYLIGMMGSGKSTIGPLLAERLSYCFIDTDTSIEKLAQQSVSQIFETVGETEFRQIETQVLAEISAYTQLVVATGGGIVVKRENWQHLQQGLVIWLNPSVELILKRLQDDEITNRPILNTADDLETKLRQILAQRRDRYAQADLQISIAENLPSLAIVEQIMNVIPTVLKKHPSASEI
jgi:shikimate kinase